MNADRHNCRATRIQNTCCCCFSGELGLLIIGWLGVIVDIITVCYVIRGSPSQQLPGAEKIVTVTATIVGLIINLLLIIGVGKGFRSLMIPWICVNMFVLIASIPVAFNFSTFLGTVTDHVVVDTLILLVIFALHCHFIHVACVHFKYLTRRESDHPYYVKDQTNGKIYKSATPSVV